MLKGISLSTEALESGLKASGNDINLIGSEYKRLDKSGEYVYTVFYHSDVYSDKPVYANDVYVKFINENSYEVDFY